MRHAMPRHILPPLALLAAAFAWSGPLAAQETATIDLAVVDAVFEDFDGIHGPGCAVGVSEDGRIVLERAYGMANLEHGVPNGPETVFEPGSVSKQFTAAATILLALDGKISLDDDIRTYIPELPDYGEPITIRHLINHTSGLRDWGSVAGIGGWPRTTRIHTHTHMLDIASRQTALNYPPGRYYSYTNTGYNLQAVLVERVSGMSFAEFSRERIFEPLGMDHTQWRDDFQRLVKDRAVAHVPDDEDGWRMLMPFENVHGNGGLLTTVGDLLRFTHNLETGELGGPRFLEEMHRQGVLDSGRTIAYASGLFLGEYRGVPEVQHSGGTAGYRGFLTRFPEQGVAVSVMCNAGSASPGRFAHEVADLFLGDAVGDVASDIEERAIDVDDDVLQAVSGGYRDTRTGEFVFLRTRNAALQMGGATLHPVSETRFESEGGIVLEVEISDGGRPALVMDSPVADDVRLEPVDASFDPGPSELAEYAGAYRSDEAEATYWFEADGGELVMRDRYDERETLEPVYPDAFRRGGTTLIFHRDASGRVAEMQLSQGRVWDLRFQKVP